jgi:hypothetical protein
MRSHVDDSSTPEERRLSKRPRCTRPDIGLTIAALTGVAVLGMIGARALSRNSDNVEGRKRCGCRPEEPRRDESGRNLRIS